MSTGTTKVSYTISEKSKNITDNLKKEHKINMSNLVDKLFKFDREALSTFFDLWKKNNIDDINNYSRCNTDNGTFIWDKAQILTINTLPLNKIEEEMLSIAAINLQKLSVDKKDEYSNMVTRMINVEKVLNYYTKKTDSLEKQIKDLQDNDKEFLELINLMQKKENL
jgi:hypothetical protein